MRILLDTNVLLRMAEPRHPQQEIAQRAAELLVQRDDVVCVVPQVMYEFWVVATRSLEHNGLGMTTETVGRELDKLQVIFTVLDDRPGILDQWRRLVARNDVKGKNAHDARIVAAMVVHQIPMLVTFNTPDFGRFTDITQQSPSEILAAGG